MTHKRFLFSFLIIVLLLTACGPAAVPTAANIAATATTASQPSPTDPALTATNTPPAATDTPVSPTATAQPPTSTSAPALSALPPDPQRIEFQAEDGAALVGYYYPAAVNPAPVVVLMHWAGGDQTDWLYVGMAAWLQNRGVEVPVPAAQKYFDASYPFPPLPEGLSFAVFTFDFRTFGESIGSGGQDKYILDARAAYTTAAALPGVNPARVAGIGASIGADGVVDGCNEACVGALSLGPGNWLKMSYSEAVKAMDGLGKPVWCVAAEDDETGAQTCRSATGEHYYSLVHPSGGHAMRLFRIENNLQPPIEQTILDFLRLVFDLPHEY